MDTLVFLQHYWWFLIALLGAVLVFLLFVQGGQGCCRSSRTLRGGAHGAPRVAGPQMGADLHDARRLRRRLLRVVSALLRRQLRRRMLRVAGAPPPLRDAGRGVRIPRQEGSLYGRRTYDAVLAVGGTGSPFLLGTALGTLFTGAPFVVNRFGMARTDGDLFIARWTSPWHGLEALADYRNAALGLALVFLSRLLACHYFLSAVTDPALRERARRRSLPAAALFLAAFGLFFRRGGERRRLRRRSRNGHRLPRGGQAAPQPAPDAPRGGPLRRAASPRSHGA